ncbi:hypothetical protein ABZV77_11425 [Streptomyces sp. NPDC004732]|uniref:hypothetical protein n=1 Tax=Streptomyces sp. NPDC004732 TaxID=3154290 RepID=UPI0033AA236E
MKCHTCLDGYDESFKRDCVDCGKRYLGEYPTEMDAFGSYLYYSKKNLAVLRDLPN